MKKSKLLLGAVIASISTTITHAQDILWEKSFGGKHADYLMDVQPTADYGFILAGSSLSSKSGNKTDVNNGDYDYCIWKMDEKGDLDWQKSFGGTSSDFLNSIKLTKDGGFILAGTSSSNKGIYKKDDVKGQDDMWIIKLNARGGEEWQKTLGGSGSDKAQIIIQTVDGGYLVGGSSSSEISGDKTEAAFGNLDYWIVKLNTDGIIEWQKSFGGKYVDELRSLEQTSDAGYILGGYSNSPKSGNKTEKNIGIGDYWILKLDNKGVEQWQKTIGGDKDDQLYAIHQTTDKGYIVGGNSDSSSSNFKTESNRQGTDFWIIRLNEAGTINWQKTFDFGSIDVLNSLVENDDHTYLIGGYAQGEANGTRKNAKAKENTDDYIALKIDDKGDELWSEIIGSDGSDLLKKVIETRDGGYLMAGTSNPQSKPSKYSSETGGVKNTIDNLQGNNKQIEKLNQSIQSDIDSVKGNLSQSVNNEIDELQQKSKDLVGLKEDSPLKIGGSGTGNAFDFASGKSNSNNSKKETDKKLPPSGSKSNNYGNNDFWVVKLKDKNKPKVEKESFEAFPNPTAQFTNVIVNQDFEKGTASVYDLAGRQLQSFSISEKTIPIDLSGLPEGIYIVNIRTNKENGSVKIIKSRNKN